MDTKKILGIIFSILFLGAFAFVLAWGITNFNKVQDAMSGTQIYDAEDLDNAYNDGYNTALENKKEYDVLINSYRDNITSLNDTISQLNSDKLSLQNSVKEYQNQINNLNTIKSQNEATISDLRNTISNNDATILNLSQQQTKLQTQVIDLSNEKANNEFTISSLNSQVGTLKTQVNNLIESNEDKTQEIAILNQEINELEGQITVLNSANADLNSQIISLNNQIANLQAINTQLQNINNSHQETINVLNGQISALNSQISDMSLQLQNNSSSVSVLNNKIAELEKTIAYYEQYISTLESDNQVIATFEYDGSVYNIQVLSKGSNITVSDPVSTDYKIFNGWMVNNRLVDLNSYTISSNTTFVASITYKYNVNFMVDETSINSQIIEKDNCAVAPVNPTKTGYEFDGWTIDGKTIEDVSKYEITSNTTFKAVFTKLHNVSFMYEGTEVKNQIVRNGEYAIAPTIENVPYKTFNGWKLNGAKVEVSGQKIVADTIFVADVIYSYDVVFIVEDVEYDSQIVQHNNIAYPPVSPTKDGYVFDGWTINGRDIVNVVGNKITSNTTYTAKFTKQYTVSFIYEDETVSIQLVRAGSVAQSPTITNTPYKTFNGWKLNNNLVDVSEQLVYDNFVYVADIIYGYDVVFMSDDVIHNMQIVQQNTSPTLPENPTKKGYAFDGWSLDGESIINPIEVEIFQGTTFNAVYTKLYKVSFVYEDNIIETQQVREGDYPQTVNVESTPYKIFNGWKQGSTNVNIQTQAITADTTYTASISYKYEVKFKVDGQVVESQIVALNSYATAPTDTPAKEGLVFVGWTLDGTNTLTLTSYKITEHIELEALFKVTEKIYEFDQNINYNTPSNTYYAYNSSSKYYYSKVSVTITYNEEFDVAHLKNIHLTGAINVGYSNNWADAPIVGSWIYGDSNTFFTFDKFGNDYSYGNKVYGGYGKHANDSYGASGYYPTNGGFTERFGSYSRMMFEIEGNQITITYIMIDKATEANRADYYGTPHLQYLYIDNIKFIYG